jgi:hypothetical protein
VEIAVAYFKTVYSHLLRENEEYDYILKITAL